MLRATDLVPMNTPDEVVRAVQALPRTIELASEQGGSATFYQGLLFITGVGLMFAPFNLTVNAMTEFFKELP